MIKRLFVTLFFIILIVIVLIVLIANSPLMERGMEFLLEEITDQKVQVGSVRLTFIPLCKLVIRDLVIKEATGEDSLFSVRSLNLQGSILKLLGKNIYFHKMDLIGFHLKLVGDEDVCSNLLNLLYTSERKDKTEGDTKKNGKWNISLVKVLLKGGSISSTKREGTNLQTSHTIEKINGEVLFEQGDLEIKSLCYTYKMASSSISGIIKKCFTKNPEFSLQAEGDMPLPLLKGVLPHQISKLLIEKKGEVSLLLSGHLSKLYIESQLKILPSSAPSLDPYFPLTISLRAYLEQTEHLKLKHLVMDFPLGNMCFEGVVRNLWGAERKFEVRWTSKLVPSCLSHLYGKAIKVKGTIPFNGEVRGEAQDFNATAHFDCSSLSLISPYLLSKPEYGIQSIAIELYKKAHVLEISSLRFVFCQSYIELNGQVLNTFNYPKTFEASVKGTLSLPEFALLFPILEKKGVMVRGKTPLRIAIAGSYDQGKFMEIRDGIFETLGSEVMIEGQIANAFSKQCYISLTTKISSNMERFLNYFPRISNRNWQLAHLPPLSFTFDGPLNAVKIRGNCDLRGFDLTFPQIRIHTPPGGGSLQLEATVEERRKISLHDLSLNFGSSHLNLRGTISQKAPHVLPLEIEATGILRTDELITSFSKDLLGGFSTAGALSLKSIFRGDFSSFILTTDADLTETFWEIPTLIGKTRGLTNQTTFTLRKDEGLPIAVENCEWILESAKGVFSLKNLNEGSGTWFLKIKTSAIDLSSLQSLRWHRKNRFPTGEIEIDLETLFTPSDILKSSLGGFIELRNISFPFNGNDYFINTRLRAKGDHLEIPPLTIKYKSSDFTLQGNIFWGDKTQVESELTSDFIDLKDFIPISSEQVSHQEKSLKNEQGQLLDTGCKILQYQPVLNIKADISNLTVGNQNIQNCILKLNGREGYYDMHHTFSTSGEASTIKTRIAYASHRSFKENCAFTIRGLNISELARQWHWEKVPLTGRINLKGELENFSSPEGGWIDPKSLNGQLSITFTEGEIRKLAFLRNILLLMNVPTVSVFTPVLREIFIFNQLLQLAKTKGRIISLKTIPYERLEGDFSIKEGVATTEELMLISDVLTLAASGSIDISNQTLKGKIAARPFGSLRTLLIKVPGLGKKATNIQDKLLSTYFTIEGKVGEPEVKAVLLKSVKGRVRDIFSRLAERIKPKEK